MEPYWSGVIVGLILGVVIALFVRAVILSYKRRIKMMKPFWKSKTILFNVLAGGALYFVNLPEVAAAPELVAIVVAGINLVLRAITKEPVGIKAK